MSPRKLHRAGHSFARLDQATRGRIVALLHPLPWVDGLVTAEVVVTGGAEDPRNAQHPPEWLHRIWNEAIKDDTLTVDRTAEVMATAVSHHRHIAATLLQAPDAYRPYLFGFSDPLDAAAEWADGFRCGIHLHPEMHELLSDDEETRTLLTGVFGLLRDEDVPEELRATSPFRDLPPERRAAVRHETVEMLPEIVRALHGHLLDLNEENAGASATYVRATPKVRRNDPCPCGSGKKYKKCCLE
jgi:uncharacterized protein